MRTELAVQTIVAAGLALAYTAAPAAGHLITANDGRIYLHVRNGGGSPINVTIITGGTLMGAAVADTVVAVPNGADRFIGPFPPLLFNQPAPAAGQLWIDFSAVATVTVAAFR